jgi:hypothetical protein
MLIFIWSTIKQHSNLKKTISSDDLNHAYRILGWDIGHVLLWWWANSQFQILLFWRICLWERRWWSLFGLKNVVVHGVILVSDAIVAILAVEGIDEVPSGALRIGPNGNGILPRSWQGMKISWSIFNNNWNGFFICTRHLVESWSIFNNNWNGFFICTRHLVERCEVLCIIYYNCQFWTS